MLTTGFYWDLNDGNPRLLKRFFDKVKRMPSMVRAGSIPLQPPLPAMRRRDR